MAASAALRLMSPAGMGIAVGDYNHSGRESLFVSDFSNKLKPLFTLGTAVIAHQLWSVDAAQFGNQLNNFFKNLAMVGGFLAVIVIERSRGSRGLGG